MRTIIYWKGWEYVTENELHMYQSKRHLFYENSNIPICGCMNPPSHVPISRNHGDGQCKRCQKWESKNWEKYDIR